MFNWFKRNKQKGKVLPETSFVVRNPKRRGASVDLTAIDEYLSTATIDPEAKKQIEKNKQDIAINKESITKIKEEQVVQNQDIQSNKDKNTEQDSKIQATTDLLNRVIEKLKNSNLISYAGEWNSTTTYKLGQVVSYQVKLYLLKVATSLNETPSTNPTKWDLLSAPEISLDGYVSDEELQAIVDKINQQIEELKNKYNQLDNKFANYVPILGNTEVDGKTFTGVNSYKSAPSFTNDNQIPNISKVKQLISAGGTTPTWGSITGTITNQTDLMTKLNEKVDLTSTQTITGTKTFANNLIVSDPRVRQISNSSNSTTISVDGGLFYKKWQYASDYTSQMTSDNDIPSKKYVDTKVSQGGLTPAEKQQIQTNKNDIEFLRNNKANQGQVVDLTNTQTVGGKKTFTSPISVSNILTKIISSSTNSSVIGVDVGTLNKKFSYSSDFTSQITLDNDIPNKKYVDTKVAQSGGGNYKFSYVKVNSYSLNISKNNYISFSAPSDTPIVMISMRLNSSTNHYGSVQYFQTQYEDQDYYNVVRLCYYNNGNDNNQNTYIPLKVSDTNITVLGGNWYNPGGSISINIYKLVIEKA